MILPTIRQMQYLTALRDEKSFSKAAQSCFVTQSTLSAGIKELENILGEPLIDRSRRKVILTPLGQEIATDSDTILERARKMVERAEQMATPMTGIMRLGVIPTIAPFLLPDILPRIQKTYPALELQLHEDLSDRLLDKLRLGELEVLLIALPYNTPDMVQKFLFDEEFHLASPQSRNTPSNLTPADLDPGELLLLEDGHCLSNHALEACNIQLPKRRRAYSATSLATLMQMVQGGYGVTLVPDMAVKAKALPENIKLSRFSNPPPTRGIGLVWRGGSPRQNDFKKLGELITSAV